LFPGQCDLWAFDGTDTAKYCDESFPRVLVQIRY
jgi:hypothetical protein